jgi:putative NADH-flavin reductase
VRSREKLGELANRVEFVQGDYFDPEKLKLAISGAETVISTIGAPSKDSPAIDDYANAMKKLLSIMKELRIKRLIIIGGAATPNGEIEKFDWRRGLLKFIINTVMGKHLIQIKMIECRLVMQSDLDWTIVRPPRIVRALSKIALKADDHKLYRSHVSVDALTDFMLQQLVSDAWIRKTPLVS